MPREDDVNILLESAWKASIIPFGNDATFFAMKSFGNYDMAVPFLLAVIGATIGQMFNWWIGTILLRHKDKLKINEHWYAKVSKLFNRYGVFLLLFSWAPLCNLLVVIAGFVGAKPKIVLPLIIIGQAFNYGRYLI